MSKATITYPPEMLPMPGDDGAEVIAEVNGVPTVVYKIDPPPWTPFLVNGRVVFVHRVPAYSLDGGE